MFGYPFDVDYATNFVRIEMMLSQQ